MGRKLKRFVVIMPGEHSLGQELAYSKERATRTTKKRWGQSAYVRQTKY